MIIDRSTEFKYLIEPLKLEDPRLHQALDLMIDQMSSVTLEVSTYFTSSTDASRSSGVS